MKKATPVQGMAPCPTVNLCHGWQSWQFRLDTLQARNYLWTGGEKASGSHHGCRPFRGSLGAAGYLPFAGLLMAGLALAALSRHFRSMAEFSTNVNTYV